MRRVLCLLSVFSVESAVLVNVNFGGSRLFFFYSGPSCHVAALLFLCLFLVCVSCSRFSECLVSLLVVPACISGVSMTVSFPSLPRFHMNFTHHSWTVVLKVCASF